MGTCPCNSAPRQGDGLHHEVDAFPYDTSWESRQAASSSRAYPTIAYPTIPKGSGLHYNAQKVQQIAAAGDVDLPDDNEAEAEAGKPLNDAPFTPRAAAAVVSSAVSLRPRQVAPVPSGHATDAEASAEGLVPALPPGWVEPIARHLASSGAPACAVQLEEARGDDEADDAADDEDESSVAVVLASSLPDSSALSDTTQAESQVSPVQAAAAKDWAPPQREPSELGIAATEAERNRLLAKFVVITALLKASFAHIDRLEKEGFSRGAAAALQAPAAERPGLGAAEGRAASRGAVDECDSLAWGDDVELHLDVSPVSLSLSVDRSGVAPQRLISARGHSMDQHLEELWCYRAAVSKRGRGRSRSPRMVLDCSPMPSPVHWLSPRGRQSAHPHPFSIPEDAAKCRDGMAAGSWMRASSSCTTQKTTIDFMTAVAADRGCFRSDLTDDLKINLHNMRDGTGFESEACEGSLVPSLATPSGEDVSAEDRSFGAGMFRDGIDARDGGANAWGGGSMIGFNAADFAAGPARHLRSEGPPTGQPGAFGVPTLASPSDSLAGRSLSPPVPRLRSGSIVYHRGCVRGANLVAPTLSSPSGSGSGDES